MWIAAYCNKKCSLLAQKPGKNEIVLKQHKGENGSAENGEQQWCLKTLTENIEDHIFLDSCDGWFRTTMSPGGQPLKCPKAFVWLGVGKVFRTPRKSTNFFQDDLQTKLDSLRAWTRIFCSCDPVSDIDFETSVGSRHQYFNIFIFHNISRNGHHLQGPLTWNRMLGVCLALLPLLVRGGWQEAEIQHWPAAPAAEVVLVVSGYDMLWLTVVVYAYHFVSHGWMIQPFNQAPSARPCRATWKSSRWATRWRRRASDRGLGDGTFVFCLAASFPNKRHPEVSKKVKFW